MVIGVECKNVSESDAMSVIFGYTALNDVTARDLQRAHLQWFKGKSLDETAPLGPADQPPYLNQMVALETPLAPRELLDRLLDIERREGRRRDVRWGPRTLDLDIVMYRDQTCDEPDLHVPHRELPNRDFWQRELDELRGSLR